MSTKFLSPLLALICFVVVSSGCAPKIASVETGYDTVEIELTHRSRRPYTLQSAAFGELDTVQLRGSKTLSFELPTGINPDKPGARRLSLVDSYREQPVPSRGQKWGELWYFDASKWPPYCKCGQALENYQESPSRHNFSVVTNACDEHGVFRLAYSRIEEHHAATIELSRLRGEHRRLTEELQEEEARIRDIKTELTGDLKWMRDSGIYTGNVSHLLSKSNNVDAELACLLPIAEEPPPKPATACAPEDEEKVPAAQCAGIVGGCEVVLTSYEIATGDDLPDALTNPVCDAIVAAGRGQDYNLEDAAVSVLEGGLESATDGSIGRFLDEGIGEFRGLMAVGELIVKGRKAYNMWTDYQECRVEKKQICRESYRTWARTKEDIENRPQRLKSRCERLVGSIPVRIENLPTLERRLLSLESEIESAKTAVQLASTIEKDTRQGLSRFSAFGSSSHASRSSLTPSDTYSRGKAGENARIPPIQGEDRPNIEFSSAYQSGIGDGNVARGFRINLDVQPEGFLDRRLYLGNEFNMMFYERGRTDSTFEFNFVVGYQGFYWKRWAPYIQGYGGIAGRDGEPIANIGVDGGIQLYLHDEFHLEAALGSSRATPIHMSVGVGTNAKYPGYAVLAVLALALAAL